MITAAEQRLLDAINETRLVELCAELVRTPTVSPYSGDRQPSGERAGQERLAAMWRALGGQTETLFCRDELFDRARVIAPHGRQTADRPNVVASFPMGTGRGPRVLVDAHMDTVGVDHYEGKPFSGTVEDGFIHGRGSSDDKQGIAVMVEAVRALLQCGNDYHGTVICCSVVDEECDGAGRGSLACLDHVGTVAAAIVIDGSSGSISKGCTGVVTADITVRGRAGHAALGQSVNAIEKAVSLMPAFEAFRQARGNRPGVLNLGVFRGGDHPANVPNSATLQLNLKTYPEDMTAARQAYALDNGRLVRELFEQCVAAQAARDPFLRQSPPQVRWIKDVPATEQAGTATCLAEAAAQACADSGTRRPPVELLGGWGDIAHFIRAGIPAVGIGAGLPGTAHSAAEKVAIADMVATTRAVALLLHRLLVGSVGTAG